MGSPSSGSTTPPAPVDAGPGRAARAASGDRRGPRGDLVVVAGRPGSGAADYADDLGRAGGDEVVVFPDGGAGGSPSGADGRAPASDDWDWRERRASLILFLSARPSEPERDAIKALLESARQWPVRFVAVVGSFAVHLGDPEAEEAERLVLAQLQASGLGANVSLIRTGHVVGPNSDADRLLTRLAPFAPLAPRRLRSCFVDRADLFAAIEAERARAHGRRTYTILGENVPWRVMLERRPPASLGGRLARALSRPLAWLGAGRAAGAALTGLARWSPRLRPWHVHTLRPRSMRELIALCHRRNIQHVRVVGYNNGVNHFGHRHPGRTIVSTGLLRRTVHLRPGRLKADSGATIRDALDRLSERGEDLYVIPNYSYVALGTAFFVPIHGSSVDYATVADTIDRVVFFDPIRDGIVSAGRDDEAFRRNVYDMNSPVVVLRLYLRTRPKARYFVRRETRVRPSAGEILEALRDRDATNVEVRQAHSASPKVTISRYYDEPGEGVGAGAALELPRDALGRLWDRLEENPVSSFLMHAGSRHVAWHTELFFTPEEFATFWETRAQLPLRKIQLRYIHRDGMPSSPFRDEDRVSADLFMFRRHRDAFGEYLARTLPRVRTNPGKHSH
ncbi:hypothetical protein [Paludisphaera mucosa]|uniref:Uncharacterized protein n=1 Tax=Paludisphaera mucosa TaxID=3030827 RepID=A0ABT6FAS9_9BACT|nr:hypothetical protein [Paludisphaera mucosa]MDG3004698.1 hypothetical protein [Paludisphaera mucosa]